MLLEQIAEKNLFGSLRQIQDLQRQLNRILSSEEEYPTSYQYPPLNLWVSEEGAIIEVELPGVDLSDLEITVVADSITLKGERSLDRAENEAVYHRQESFRGPFARSVQLPFKIEADSVKAELNRGILQITLPRAQADKPRKISIKTAN